MAKKSRPSADVASAPLPPDTRTLPLHDAISRQAKKLWQRYGQPQGRDDEIWTEAERQVLGTDRQANQQPGGAIAAPPLGDVFRPAMQTGHRRDLDDDQDQGNGKLASPGADTGLPK